jgi:hypothetical protein
VLRVLVASIPRDHIDSVAAVGKLIQHHFHHNRLPSVAAVKDALLLWRHFFDPFAALFLVELECALPRRYAQDCGCVAAADKAFS